MTPVTNPIARIDAPLAAAYGQAQASACLGDQVWFDQDRDGVQDAGEPGIGGVAVTAIDEGAVVQATVTDLEGRYWLGGLQAGAHTVRFTRPDGLRFNRSRRMRPQPRL